MEHKIIRTVEKNTLIEVIIFGMQIDHYWQHVKWETLEQLNAEPSGIKGFTRIKQRTLKDQNILMMIRLKILGINKSNKLSQNL